MVRDTKKLQVYELLKQRIESSYYPPGSRLPKEVDLAQELRVSRVTLRPALELLEIESWITRIKGKGTFVRDARTNQTRILVLLSTEDFYRSDSSNPFVYILPCIRIAAEHANMQLEYCSTESLQMLSPEECTGQILARNIEGIFYLGNNFNGDEVLLKPIRDTKLPVLLPHGYEKDAENTSFSVLGMNYRELIKDALKYFSMLNHHRVGCIAYENVIRGFNTNDYLRWTKESLLDPDPDLLKLMVWQKNTAPDIDKAMDELMSLSDPPTAILGSSDPFTVRIYQYLQKKNIRIPEDISILTIGGQIGCDYLRPPLSAMEYNDQYIGETAVRTMLEMIHEKRRVTFMVTPHQLKIRESSKKRKH